MTPLYTRLCPYPPPSSMSHPRAPPSELRLKPGPMFVASGGVIHARSLGLKMTNEQHTLFPSSTKPVCAR